MFPPFPCLPCLPLHRKWFNNIIDQFMRRAGSSLSPPDWCDTSVPQWGCVGTHIESHHHFTAPSISDPPPWPLCWLPPCLNSQIGNKRRPSNDNFMVSDHWACLWIVNVFHVLQDSVKCWARPTNDSERFQTSLSLEMNMYLNTTPWRSRAKGWVLWWKLSYPKSFLAELQRFTCRATWGVAKCIHSAWTCHLHCLTLVYLPKFSD